uniref:uncharacterized protein LOC120340083 n=1 Tax=Styela clava TaxID=7725 RepID=UPI001939B712|nr:uncharacterized protein LOC120340083 [Styela clava]
MPVTRRGILSTVSSVYDPLGFVAPVILEGKIILQSLCKDVSGWDDPIPNDLRMRWLKWRDEIFCIENLRVRRCFKKPDFGKVKLVEYHHFSDASDIAYGQCSYVRLIDVNDGVCCSLIIGKSRVAPLKHVTIPRLELNAAVISARMNSWHHVSSSYNPSDDASRRLSAKDLSSDCRWINGPEFLRMKGVYCPPNVVFEPNETVVTELQQEMRKSTVFKTQTSVMLDQVNIGIDRLCVFSSWFRATRAVANCIRYIGKLKH